MGYARSFYDFVEYMDDTETLLAKAQLSSSPEYAARNLSEIWKKADLAQSSLAGVPVTHMAFEKSMKFLNQLSDYSYTISQSAIEGQKLSNEEMRKYWRFL